MQKRLRYLVFILLISKIISNEDSVILKITKSKSYNDQTGSLTPFVVSVSSEDKKEKVKGIDFICIIDTSGSMSGTKIQLVKNSLNYLINKLMTEDDQIAIIQFASTSSIVNGLTKMTSNNKNFVINKINNLRANGGTNIYSGLTRGLDVIRNNYLNGERIVSMILLSDGWDNDSRSNIPYNFRNYIINQNKRNYVFTLHTFGFGQNHNAELMKNLSLIRNGNYYFIEKLIDLQDAYLNIFGALSTVKEVNAKLTIQSNYTINKVYGMEDMYETTLSRNSPYTFQSTIIHFIYGKTYSFVALVNIPDNVSFGTEVLYAKITPFNKNATYLWDLIQNTFAYEEYIRCISFTFFENSYNAGQAKGISIIDNGIIWIKSNYDGIRDWATEYEGVKNDLNNFGSYGRPNLLSKIRKFKSCISDFDGDDENSYQRKIIDDSYNIDTTSLMSESISSQKTISLDGNYNYYYFYLIDGIGEINNLHFSGNRSSIIIYSAENKYNINIKPISQEIEYYYWKEKTQRIQTIVDFSRGGKFIYNRDFPFDFYTAIDGKKDITFNIQFLNLEYPINENNTEHLFEINAYIIDQQQVNYLKSSINALPTTTPFTGYYDKGFRVGKIVIKKEEMAKLLSSNNRNFLYVIISKASDSNNIYTSVEGQFSFVSMDYTYAVVPENFYIFSNLSPGKNIPHLYTLKMEEKLNKRIRIEFATSGNELDCAVLKYQNYLPSSEELFYDSKEFNINKNYHMGKTYIDIINENDEEFIILSIFSTNGNNIASSELTKLSYVIRYSTESDYGLYSINDFYEKDGEIEIERNEEDKRNITINFYPLKSKKIDEQEFSGENTRYFIKLYPIVKQRQKLYETISLFQSSIPEQFYEKNINYTNDKGYFDFQIDLKQNYFFTVFTISNKNNEIISYKNKKIIRALEDIEIDDENSLENEMDESKIFDVKILKNITKKYLLIKISDFGDGEYGTLYATLEDTIYKSVQPSNNYIIISKEKCEGKTINVEIKLKDNKKTEYYLSIKFVDQIEINVGENLYFQMLEEYKESMEIIINNNDENENKINIFVQSTTGNFNILGLNTNLEKSETFGAQSINIIQTNPIFFEIHAKTGDFISINTHIINNSKKRIISNHEISLYGLLQEKDCIYFSEKNEDIEKYQIRILGDKEISIKYNKDTIYEITKPGILYIKEFSGNELNKICLKQKNDLDSIFFGIQIIDISKQTVSNVILQPLIFGSFYNDKLYKNEIRYYRQGLFDNEDEDLRYLYNVRQIKGEIKVYVTQCNNFPYCSFSKEDIEKNDKVMSLYNINDIFVYSKKAVDLYNYDPEKFYVYIILCLSDSCEYTFIINKSTSIIDLTEIQKFSSKIYRNNIDKFSILPQNENTQIISITLYTHSGEVMLSTNDNCEEIKHTIFGHIEKLDIPKSCGFSHSSEIYVQANMDSVYSIEYSEILDINYSIIKSNIIHIENIYNEKTIKFLPEKNSYIIKFIPINCEISIKYEENKYVPSQQGVYYYYSESEMEKYNLFNISTKNEDCMVYTYIEELIEDFYGILSDQVPYYISLNKNNNNYKLIYPIPNEKYGPRFKINFVEETPIKIYQQIENEKDKEINAIFTKDIKPSSNILKKCDGEDICYLIIEINYENNNENIILLEVIPKSLNEIPGVLLDNKLKQDFTNIDGTGQQYMAKILKDEEGEIYFNYKYFNGEFNGKLINIEKKSWKNRYDLPEKNEYLSYDYLKQKLRFTKKETNRCNNGCYLFVEINNIEKFKEEKDYKELNMDYSIYLKKFDNVIQLKLNEFIIGTLTETIESGYIEYYSIEIPYSTDKIFIDYSSENTYIIINSNDIKPTINNYEDIFESIGKDQIFTINSENLKGKRFIIGIYTKKLNNGVSQYSFRIRAEHKLIKNYIYSDISTENICETKENNKSCYFLIPVVNIQPNSNLFLYGISSSNSDDLIISYKKIKIHENITNEEYIDNDIYEKTSEEQFIKNMLLISNSELKLNEDENILIKIFAPEKGTITLLHSFKSNLYESLLNPKNKVVYSMNPNEELYLNIPNGVKSLVHINVINGKGKVGFENDINSIQEISGKYSSMYLQGIENNDDKRIKINTDSENSFNFYTYIKLGSIKRNINDISFGSARLRTGEGFPIEFYTKISENEDYIINFNIQNIKEIEDVDSTISIFNIKGFIVTEDIIETLKLDDTYVYSGTPFIGKYETGIGIAKLVLTNEDIQKYYSKGKNNYIYLLIEDSYENPSILNNIYGEITILQNNNLNYVTPENTYINGNLEIGKNSTNKYKLIKKNSNDKKIRVEFSSSSDNVKYKMYYNTFEKLRLASTQVDYEVVENLGKQNIDINLEDEFDSFIFEVYTDSIEDDKNKLSYTLRYRTDEGKIKFKNYKLNGTVELVVKKKDNNKYLDISIPRIQDSNTLEFISANYYLKVYKYNEKDIIINNTISILDGIEPYKIYEFNINEEFYKKNIEIPNDDNKYYATITAVTSDKELLSYTSFAKKEKEEEEDDDDDNDWIIIVIIIIAILLIIFIILLIHCLLKKRRNKVEEESSMPIIPITSENKLEERSE